MRSKCSLIKSSWLASSLMTVGLWVGGASLPAQAETFLEQSGTIIPAEKSYTFEGTSGQEITITLESQDFDPVLVLTNSAGEEVATNDDFGGTLNSTIIVTLPKQDTYTVVARSFAGQGGDYQVMIRTSTPYEVAYGEGQTLSQQSDFEGAIAAYTEAIGIDEDQPSAYLGRAEATLGQIYAEQGESITGPQDIPEATREAIIADFEKAADQIEALGNQDWATSLREQANYLREGDSSSEDAPSEGM